MHPLLPVLHEIDFRGRIIFDCIPYEQNFDSLAKAVFPPALQSLAKPDSIGHRLVREMVNRQGLNPEWYRSVYLNSLAQADDRFKCCFIHSKEDEISLIEDAAAILEQRKCVYLIESGKHAKYHKEQEFRRLMSMLLSEP